MGRTPHRTEDVFGRWETLARAGEPANIARGDVLYAADTPADAVYVLVQGHVGLHLHSDDDRTLMVRELAPGQMFGHMALVGKPHDTHAEMLKPGRLYRIGREKLYHLMQHDAGLALSLLYDLTHHRAVISSKLDEVGFMTVSARLASVLLNLAEQYDASHMLEMPRRSHRQLAEMVNAYRETVTKTINEFREQKLLEINQATIRLLNRAGLEELAQNW